MSIKKPNVSNLGSRKEAARVADTFQRPSDDQTKLTHRISTPLHRRFKLAVVAEGRTMGDVMEELIEEWTTKHGG
ncbi:plasmid partition protein ParG [Rhodococcus baikonurensis]|uniref:Plasmid partition protein ParG n=1 Tax=Rhodococcus baikonurensis TaxID=172041 RepID=A0ABV5XTX4_9NOCA